MNLPLIFMRLIQNETVISSIPIVDENTEKVTDTTSYADRSIKF